MGWLQRHNYNIEQNGETALKMENWVDMNEDGNEDGPWEKVDENIDAGGWGSEGEECGGEPDQIITWGGPIATFRWDGASDVDIKNFSVREIEVLHNKGHLFTLCRITANVQYNFVEGLFRSLHFYPLYDTSQIGLYNIVNSYR